jgi:DMSO/TMAO reductase YedYZ heme-binding membrane subunit
MTQLRVLKVITVCAFLVLVITAWVYQFDVNGYTRTLASLRKSYGDSAYLFIALFSVVSLVSMPIFGIAGLVGMISSRRLGRSALILGLLCCVLSFANLVLWKKYGGIPSHSKPEGVQQIYQTAAPSSPAKKP